MNATTDTSKDKPKKSNWPLTLGIVTLAAVVFLAIVIPGVSYTTCKGYARGKTRAQISAVMLACTQYQSSYGTLPAADGPVRNYNQLYAILSGSNTRGIVFIGGLTYDKAGRRRYTDAWNNDLIVILSSSGTIQAGTGGICETVKSNIAIWSKGPNRIDNHGAGDDITSWK